MNVSTPHFLLSVRSGAKEDSGRWGFALYRPDGSQRLDAVDVEPKVRGERLDLLAVVRALESLDQPSQVTLIGCSRYVQRGLEYGLPEWRENGWQWEYFGQMVPVKNGDLWQRLDRALRFHRVECRRLRIDGPHGGPARELPKQGKDTNTVGVRVVLRGWLEYAGAMLPRWGRWGRRRSWRSLRRLLRRTAQPWKAAVLDVLARSLGIAS